MAERAFPDPPLGDGAVRLRPWRADDAPAIARACSDPLIPRFVPAIPSPYTEQDAQAWLASHEPLRRAGRSLELAIADAGTDEVLGAIAAHLNAENRSALVGYWLAPDARGHGHATTATRLLCTWLFDVVELGRIGLTTDPDNLASQHVAQRCGFQREGHLRAHELFRSTGLRRDSLIWGLLPGELT